MSCVSRAGWCARDAQRVEVVVLPLDLGALGDLEAHLLQRREHVAHRLRDRVQAADEAAAPGQRHVDGAGFERLDGALLD